MDSGLDLLRAEQEREANYFAMCLLMPEKMVLDFMGKRSLDIDHDERIQRGAKLFAVSEQLFVIRLAQLGYMGTTFRGMVGA